jgi:GNAT superfamily N-acetyltransferase
MRLDACGPGRRYHTRRLEPPDLPALQRLFERSADYFEATAGAPPAPDEAERAFVGGPPTRSVNDKQTIGVFDGGGTLVGVLDAIPDFPTDGTCTIGLLLLDAAARGGGLGRATLTAFESWMSTQGATRFRTAVVASLEGARRFLERCGYHEVSRLEGYEAATHRPTLVFLEKDGRAPAARRGEAR